MLFKRSMSQKQTWRSQNLLGCIKSPAMLCTVSHKSLFDLLNKGYNTRKKKTMVHIDCMVYIDQHTVWFIKIYI